MLKALVFALWKRVKNLICDVDELNNEVNELNDDVDEIKSKYIKKEEINVESDYTTLKKDSIGYILKLESYSDLFFINTTPLPFTLEQPKNFTDIVAIINFPTVFLKGTDKTQDIYNLRVIKTGENSSMTIRLYNNGMSDAFMVDANNFDIKNKVLKNIKNYDDATLSGTPKIIEINLGGTPYYIKAYPTKS